MAYSTKVIEHYENPKNVGTLDKADPSVGTGLVGYAALHKEAVLVPDVSVDPRYLKVVDDVRSELIVPILVEEKVWGIINLDGAQPDAFDEGILSNVTLLAELAGGAAAWATACGSVPLPAFTIRAKSLLTRVLKTGQPALVQEAKSQMESAQGQAARRYLLSWLVPEVVLAPRAKFGLFR